MRLSLDSASQVIADQARASNVHLNGTGRTLRSTSHGVRSETARVISHEAARLETVRRYDALDGPPDKGLDRITALAARLSGAPISLISIVDEDRIGLVSHHGLAIREVAREPGLCASVIISTDPYVVRDAVVDPRTRENALVVGEPRLRFYAGAPLRTAEGHNLGALCVVDTEPRDIDPATLANLVDLAALAVDRMDARRAAARAELMSREIDHRVMNSLQFVSGLLAMQARAAGSDAVSHQLRLAAARIDAVAQVHRQFQAVRTDTPCLAFIERLCRDLESILDRRIVVSGSDHAVASNTIQPIGLLVNELVTNAAKHGRGRIDVAFGEQPIGYALTVADEGPGLPDGFDPSAYSNGLGMRVVSAIATQLGGSVNTGTRPGGGGYVEVAFRS